MEENSNNQLLQQKIVADQFINLVFAKEDGSYVSYFVNNQNGKMLELEDLIKAESKTAFQQKIIELLYVKYPKFIADILIKEEGDIAYEVREQELVIYYSNFKINPSYKEKVYLTVNYHEIKDYLNFPVSLSEEYENENAYHYDSKKKTVALTFDDGPNKETTLKIVELLNQNKSHATFFMVGNRMEKGKEVIQKVLESNNEIGSHSYHHANLTRLKKDALIEEERKTNEIYKSITKEDLKLIRAPYGATNSTMKESLSYSFINWNLDPEDWRYRNATHIYNEIINNVEDGDIILLHDLYKTTIEALEKILPELYVRGFQVVSVSELATLKGQTLEMHKVYHSFK